MRGGSVVRAILVVVVLLAALGGVYALKAKSDRDKEKLPTLKETVDADSGVSWKMYGKPEVAKGTSDLVLGVAEGDVVPVRTYTADHGDWVERIKVFEVAPGEMDFTAAARTAFDSKDKEDFADLKYLKVATFDGATGSLSGTAELGGNDQDVDAQVFVAQANRFLVVGGVAQKAGRDAVDLKQEAARLRQSIEVA